ncbi:tail protein [Arthrobacter phage Yang]|uniref:Minor tail protein n=1 Tax=Arthrobacter phage Yang TaxID=2419970 RepID=A0A3G2KJB1_9CAUD|nr:tail protein [Arthrobacter phage Yang]AYN59106.1 minor tail protein [Arthrobacter phage Yang]
MADAAAKLAARLAELERRLVAMERGQQLRHSTVDVGGEALTVPDALSQGIEALTASVELDGKLTTAQSDLDASKARLDAAEADIVDAFGQIDTVDGKADAADAKAVAAQTAASDAQTAADNAHTAADDAATAAANAAGIANGKGKALIQSTAPATADQNAVTLWIDTTGGANTPKRWNGSAWVAVTDKAATDAATAAANAASAAAAADAKAVAAQTAAGNAQSTADSALTMAGSKGKVYYDTTTPSGTGTAAGDLWRRVDSSKNVIGEWYWTGSAWQSSQITTSAISNLDVGKLTAGSAAILTVTAQKIAASTAAFQTVDVKNLFATSGTLDTAVIDKLWTDVVNSRKITTGMLLVGRGSNLINWTPGDVTLFKSQSGGGGTTYYATSDTDAGGACVRSDAPNVTAGSFAYVTQISSGTTAANGLADAYDIEPGAAYRLQMRATYGGTTQPGATTQPTVRFMVRFFDGAKASLGDVIDTAGAGKAAYSGALVTWEGQAPSNAVAAHIYLQQDQPTGATGQLYLSLFGFYKKTSSVLIEDGAVTADKLEAQLVLTSEVIAGDPAGNHAKLDANGFRVMAPPSTGADPVEVIRLGTETDDYFGVVGADGNLTASITAAGGVSAKEVNVADTLTLAGEDLGSRIDYMPQRLTAWGQVPIDSTTMLINGSGEIGLFELGWDSNQADGREGRMYRFSLNPLLIRSTAVGQAGLRLRYTTDGSKPTINSQLLQYSYGWIGAASGFQSLVIDRIIGSNNGEYLRVLVTLWNGTSGTASVVKDSNQTHMFSTVVDLGGSTSPTAIASTGGGTTGTKAPVTTTKEYKANAIKSYTGTGAWYNYNTGYMYSGLSPANYGDLRSVATFPSFTSDLSGATVNDVWIYVYYDFWYYGSGGNAAISLHGYSTPPGSSPSLSFSMMSNGWPRAAGRWVRLPDSTYAGFKSGTYKGFGLGGHGGGYSEYGYAHDARIKIRYTK